MCFLLAEGPRLDVLDAFGAQQLVDWYQDPLATPCASSAHGGAAGWGLVRQSLGPASWSREVTEQRLSCSASSIAGSLSVNHCCMRWTRSSDSAGDDESARLPSGVYGAISATSLDHVTAGPITSRNSTCRVRFVEVPNPRLV
jgi:hypothetical protein